MKKRKSKAVLRPSRLIFLIVLVASNTFAWFIYATKIDTNISVHVRSWNVVFEAGENTVTDIVDLDVDDIYPGMDNYNYSITAYNRSELSATFSYVILEARILDTRYVTTEGRAEYHEEVLSEDLTSAALQSKLASDYPFAISLAISGSTIAKENGTQDFSIGVVWPYESNDDVTDTYWGTSAYDYKQSYPSNPSIAITLRIIITQASS